MEHFDNDPLLFCSPRQISFTLAILHLFPFHSQQSEYLSWEAFMFSHQNLEATVRFHFNQCSKSNQQLITLPIEKLLDRLSKNQSLISHRLCSRIQSGLNPFKKLRMAQMHTRFFMCVSWRVPVFVQDKRQYKPKRNGWKSPNTSEQWVTRQSVWLVLIPVEKCSSWVDWIIGLKLVISQSITWVMASSL